MINSFDSMIKSFLNSMKPHYPVNVNLIFKLLAITVICKIYLFQTDFKLPFLDFLIEMEGFVQISWVTTGFTVAGIVMVLLTASPRLGSALIAMGILITIISCRPCYSDGRLYLFSLFLLLALYDKNFGVKFLRIQVIILYFGSGVNKLFDFDWQTGQYIENWLAHQIEHSVYIGISSILPSMVLAKIVSWTVIIMEISIAFCFTRKRTFMTGIWLGILLHSGSMIATNDLFGAFIIGSFISYLAFIEWPDHITMFMPESSKTKCLLKYYSWIDPYYRITMEVSPNNNITELFFSQRKYSGFRAFQLFLVYCPFSYVALIGLTLAPSFGHVWLKGLFLIVGAFLMLPISAKVIDKVVFRSKGLNEIQP